MSTKFIITGNDLIDGTPENTQCCAVALAVTRDIIAGMIDEGDLVPNIDGDGNYYIQERLKDNDGFITYQDRYWIDMKDEDSYELLDFISWFDCIDPDDNDESAKIFQEHVERYDKRPWSINYKLVEVEDARKQY